jgi:uncharacterized protein YjbI with pentapeptide repeats
VLPETTIMQTALTFDEGGNFINVNFSPLTPWDLTAGATFGSLRADYHITSAASVAINAGTSRSSSNRVPTNDFDGQNRQATNVDIGADEIALPAPILTAITPDSGALGTSVSVTLSGANLTGATLSETASNFSVNVTVVSATQITATITIGSTATIGAKTLTVTTAGGSATVSFTVVAPPPPTLTSISPSSGVRPATGTANYAVTLNGTNLTGATLTEASSNFSLSNVIVVSATQITATVQVQSGASLGTKTLTVTTSGGNATVDFAVVPAASVSFTSEVGPASLNGSGTTLSFGNQSGNTVDTVTVTVGGTGAVTFQTATVTNGVGTEFSKGADTCSGTTKNPGDICTILVNFNAPSGTNSRTGTLSVPYTGGAGSPVNLTLTGS